MKKYIYLVQGEAELIKKFFVTKEPKRDRYNFYDL